jgi:hypothetical protein
LGHLHIAEKEDQFIDLLAKSLKSVSQGTLKLELGTEQVLKIDISENSKIIVNLLKPSFFKTPGDETGFFDKLKTAKEFAHKLAENGITLSFLRKGKEAITLGNDARPSALSKLITRSDDVEIDSIKESAKLKRDFKAD